VNCSSQQVPSKVTRCVVTLGCGGVRLTPNHPQPAVSLRNRRHLHAARYGVSKSRVAVTAIVATHIALFSTIWSSQIVLHTAQWAFAPLILSEGTVLSSRNTRLVPCHLLP